MPVIFRRIIRNGIINASGSLLQLIILACAYRLWLTQHGATVTDTWLILIAIVNCGALCDLGLSGVIVQQCASPIPGHRAAWMTAGAYFLRRAVIVGGLGSGLAAWCWLGATTHSFLCACALAAWVGGLVWTNYQAGILKAELRFGTAATIVLIQHISAFLLPALVPVGSELLSSVIIAATGSVVAAMCGMLFLQGLQRGVANQAILPRQLIVLSLPYAAQNGLAFFYSHFQRLALSSSGHPGDIAALSAAQSVFNKAQGLIGAATESLNPEVARGAMSPLWLWRAVCINALICLIGFAVVTVIAYPLFEMWLPGDVGTRATMVMPILAGGYAVASSTSVAVHILNGMGHPWGNPLCGAISALVSVIILCVGKYYDINPLFTSALAVSIAYLVYTALLLAYAYRILRTSQAKDKV